MDLRSIINTEAGDSSSKQATPVTPIQAPSQQQQQQHAFREYGHPPHASPGKHPSQDYGIQQPGGPYASPKIYQGNYQNRPPPPPPIQPPSQNDLRSPARSYSAQSPYQRTPSSTMSTAQYPFPHTNQTPQSPAQLQQYPPSYQQRERERERDSYPQQNPPPPPHLQHQGSHSQASPTPHTPPIGMPSAPLTYIQHQRSHSSVSTSTPTSAQSQTQYYNQYPHDSPVSAGHIQHSQLPQHARQQSVQSQHSQPGTPLGPPLNTRPASGVFTQPSSPFQQRGHSIGPFSHQQQTSPAPAAPASIPRLPSTPNAYDSQRTSISEQHRRSQSERERSLSVSPKTRLPSQPLGYMAAPQDNSINSTKRKMEDREIAIEQPRRVNQPEIKQQVNGEYRVSPTSTASPTQPPKKRIRYTEPPIWAQSVRSKGLAGAVRGPPKANGQRPTVAPPVRVETNGSRHQSPTGSRVAVSAESHPSNLLGAWETSISGVKPAQPMTKEVADFIFRHVVSRNDLGELASRGVEIEIEAKLGQLVKVEDHERLNLPVTTDCVISEGYRMINFESAMSENQHQVLNTFLNAKVAEAHPSNPQRAKSRVEIVYVHRREVDKFYELPPSMNSILPAAVMQQRQNTRHAPKVRITYDQKTNDVLAKIIKVRIADLNLYMPQHPLDCRISINFEMKFDGDIDEITSFNSGDRAPDRRKDRLSYTQGPYQVDLTQITKTKSHNGVNLLEKEHELEVEVSTAAIRDQGTRAVSREPNEYLALVEGMIDNIRVLSRAVPQH